MITANLMSDLSENTVLVWPLTTRLNGLNVKAGQLVTIISGPDFNGLVLVVLDNGTIAEVRQECLVYKSLLN